MYIVISKRPQELGRFSITPDAARAIHRTPIMMKSHERGNDMVAVMFSGHLGLSVLCSLNQA
jgi:hypothetical protein